MSRWVGSIDRIAFNVTPTIKCLGSFYISRPWILAEEPSRYWIIIPRPQEDQLCAHIPQLTRVSKLAHPHPGRLEQVPKRIITLRQGHLPTGVAKLPHRAQVVGQSVCPHTGAVLRQDLALDLHVVGTRPAAGGDDDFR